MGREFLDVFKKWANSYDQTVYGHDGEYKEVFLHYDDILEGVAKKAMGNTIEFGVGTGNLYEKLLKYSDVVFGIEPSLEMRNVAEGKFQGHIFYDGDFLKFPSFDSPIHSIVHTYAFHHLTDEEKSEAIGLHHHLLAPNGKIVFADTMFETSEVKQSIIQKNKDLGYYNLVNDLKTEYYPTINVLKTIFEAQGFHVTFTRKNEFVWIVEAVKRE